MKKYLPQKTFCFLFLVFLYSPIAGAAVIDVNTTTDELNADGDCSLREAITAANTDAAVDACAAGSGVDTVNIPAGTYTLTIAGTGENSAATGDLDITAGVTLKGDDANTTIVDGAGLDRVFDIVASNDFEVTIKKLTITGGTGGGIYAYDWDTASKNTIIRVKKCKVINNLGSRQGGGINATYVSLFITQSTISGNSITSWSPGAGGGGIFLAMGPTFWMRASTVSGNSIVAAGLFGTDGSGGGIALYGTFDPDTATIIDSTISGNSITSSSNITYESRQWGGGIYVMGVGLQLSLYNVTIANNNVGYSTIDSNGGGIYINYGNTNTIIQNTLIADNTKVTNLGGATSNNDCLTAGITSSIATANYSHIEDTTNCTIIAGSVNTGDPSLGALANNGGPTETHALLEGSTAIDAGDPGDCLDDMGDKINNDQRRRGFRRHKDGDNNGSVICDIGAYEYSPGAIPVLWIPPWL